MLPKKLAKKLNLEEKVIRNICAQEHLIKKVYSKSELKTIDITFKGDSLSKVRKIAKALKVSNDAVIGGILYTMAHNESK